jgi:hypothetical protein
MLQGQATQDSEHNAKSQAEQRWSWGCTGGNGERGNSLSFNEQRQQGMLPLVSVHEDVNSINFNSIHLQ